MKIMHEHCGLLMGLLMNKFTITHPSVVAVITATQVYTHAFEQ